jgi:hypothetical protein
MGSNLMQRVRQGIVGPRRYGFAPDDKRRSTPMQLTTWFSV